MLRARSFAGLARHFDRQGPMVPTSNLVNPLATLVGAATTQPPTPVTVTKAVPRLPDETEASNLTDSIRTKIGVQLHRRPNHPINIITHHIRKYFEASNTAEPRPVFQYFDDLSPVVTVEQNFDRLLIPQDHVSRSRNDTYYLSESKLLRCHTSAHQHDLIKAKHEAFLVAADVYRRDETDASHYPVFHQMEGVRTFNWSQLEKVGIVVGDTNAAETFISRDLKRTLEGLMYHLFGKVEMQWVPGQFPFTRHSKELEIFFNGNWLETLGCGVIQPRIMSEAGRPTEMGWAFGLGLERLAMVLFSIPDVRLFWSSDPRFVEQFKSTDIIQFKPFSKYPACTKDVSFWLSSESVFHPNDLHELVRSLSGDQVEDVKLIDKFNRGSKESLCFRITYRSLERTLTNAEVDAIQEEVRKEIVRRFKVELR